MTGNLGGKRGSINASIRTPAGSFIVKKDGEVVPRAMGGGWSSVQRNPGELRVGVVLDPVAERGGGPA